MRPKINYQKLGDAVKKIRRIKNLTLQQLSEYSGVSVTLLDSLENGGEVDRKDIELISSAFGLPLSCLEVCAWSPKEQHQAMSGLRDSIEELIMSTLVAEEAFKNENKNDG